MREYSRKDAIISVTDFNFGLWGWTYDDFY